MKPGGVAGEFGPRLIPSRAHAARHGDADQLAFRSVQTLPIFDVDRSLELTASMPQLIFTTPHFSNQRFKLPEGKTTVGRVAGNTLIIQHDTISANHCEILLYGREVIVRDRGSTNGTWVDDCRVKGQTCMHHGQRIRFGGVEARLELPPRSFEDQHTEVTAIHLLTRSAKVPLPSGPETAVIIRPHACADCTSATLANLSK